MVNLLRITARTVWVISLPNGRVTGYFHFDQSPVNLIDRLIQSGSSRGQPHCIQTVKPFGLKFGGPLHLETGNPGLFTQGSQLTRVVRVLSSHYDQRLHLWQQIFNGFLSFSSRAANRVDELDHFSCILSRNRFEETVADGGRSSGLANDSDPVSLISSHVFGPLHHGAAFEVAHDA